MPFSYRSFRKTSPTRAGAFVLAVGHRVHVARSEGGPVRVALTDDAGAKPLGSLADGNQVEILAWQPRGAGTRYRVRSLDDGLEGWLAVGNLRRADPVLAPSRPLPTPPAMDVTPPRPKHPNVSGVKLTETRAPRAIEPPAARIEAPAGRAATRVRKTDVPRARGAARSTFGRS